MRYSLLFLLAVFSFPLPPRGNCAEDGLSEDVRKYVVPRQIKEIESKNPMKASKKGAPAAAAAKKK